MKAINQIMERNTYLVVTSNDTNQSNLKIANEATAVACNWAPTMITQIEEKYTQIAYSWNINKFMFVSSGEILPVPEIRFPSQQNSI